MGLVTMSKYDGLTGILILAHPDDEVFIINYLGKLKVSHTIYLTNGVRSGAKYSGEIRRLEAEESWQIIDPNVRLIHFGSDHNLRDGMLHKDISKKAISQIKGIVSEVKPSFIITTLNDGSHQDHDTTFYVARSVLPQECDLFAFPTYRSNFLFPRMFRVMKVPPGLKLGQIKSERSIKKLILALRIMIVYKTQIVTWVGLAPGILVQMILGSRILLIDQRAFSFQPRHFFYQERGRANVQEVREFQDKNLEL